MGWGILGTIANGAASAASAAGDAVEGIVNTTADAVEGTVDIALDGIRNGISRTSEWVCKSDGSVGCGAANFIGGAIDGVLQGGQGILDSGFGAIRELGATAGSALRLDGPGFLRHLISSAIHIVSGLIKIIRFILLGYVVGGIVQYFKRSELIHFVDDLLSQRFKTNAELLAEARQNVGLGSRQKFGLRVAAEHRLCSMDSDEVELWRMHRDGIIDLYALAGLLSFDSFQLKLALPDATVRLIGPDGEDAFMPVGRSVISRHLETEGQAWRLRVYPMSKGMTARRLQLARRKLQDLGVILKWNNGENFATFRSFDRQPISESEYNFDYSRLEELLATPKYRRERTNCTLLALTAFTSSHLGRTVGKDIAECLDHPNPLTDQANCVTELGFQATRTDLCCQQINPCDRSGLVYRDAYPEQIFQYVLPHEIGHFFGLCHCGHEGPQNIMYRIDVLGFWDWGIVSFYWEEGPHFSLDDAKNSWRMIVDQLGPCLVRSNPIITSAAITEATVGQQYVYQPTVEGEHPIGWCLDTNPVGMRIAPAGTVTWLPTSEGEFGVTIAAVNAMGQDLQEFSIKVTGGIVVE